MDLRTARMRRAPRGSQSEARSRAGRWLLRVGPTDARCEAPDSKPGNLFVGKKIHKSSTLDSGAGTLLVAKIQFHVLGTTDTPRASFVCLRFCLYIYAHSVDPLHKPLVLSRKKALGGAGVWGLPSGAPRCPLHGSVGYASPEKACPWKAEVLVITFYRVRGYLI